ncbi:unnamed protein product [Haemonchus placei]|uniref:HYPK_UBA domain-containing protein n=1 Tax=Haemonchus placei TaxID=6290 RepID=A0A0N4VUR0_HAEPC|nr:unnamed protein product [Haemonchus placei]
MKSDYDTTKSKDDKKNILQELEKVEEEVKYTAVLNDATEMILMLNTRLTEAGSNERRLARKLGTVFQS